MQFTPIVLLAIFNISNWARSDDTIQTPASLYWASNDKELEGFFSEPAAKEIFDRITGSNSSLFQRSERPVFTGDGTHRKIGTDVTLISNQLRCERSEITGEGLRPEEVSKWVTKKGFLFSCKFYVDSKLGIHLDSSRFLDPKLFSKSAALYQDTKNYYRAKVLDFKFIESEIQISMAGSFVSRLKQFISKYGLVPQKGGLTCSDSTSDRQSICQFRFKI